MVDEQRSTAQLETLARLHRQGSLTDDEFTNLRQSIFSDRDSAAVATKPIRSVDNAGRFWTLVVIGIICLIAIDHVKGSIFPDDVYCMVGAGVSIDQPGRTEANSWSANDGCSAYRPECANSWTYRPPTTHCVHGTFWDAIRSKVGA